MASIRSILARTLVASTVLAAPYAYAQSQPTVAPLYYAPPQQPNPPLTYEPPYYPDNTGSASSVRNYKANRFALGIEGFYDRYQEESLNVKRHAGMGSVTADYAHYFTRGWYGELNARGSYGTSRYKRPGTEANGIPEWEAEGRFTTGYDFLIGRSQYLKPYIGFGARYFSDEGKDHSTTAGAPLFDRDGYTLYAPIGLAYDFPAFGYRFVPLVEYGQRLYSTVSSHYGDIPGYYDVDTEQKSGYELRGEFMMRNLDSYGQGLEVGPFVRYWHFNNSQDATTPPTPSGTSFNVPDNNRLQIGAAIRYRF